MKVGDRQLDHIVYCVFDLDNALEAFEQKTGLTAKKGGRHPQHGTKNAIVNLGAGAYLEFLAIDTKNVNVQKPRWMGIDYLSRPRITRWCIKSTQLSQDQIALREFDSNMGNIITGSRQTEDDLLMSWEMIEPLSSPEVELLPFMIDWTKSDIHPTDGLQELCALNALQFTISPKNTAKRRFLEEYYPGIQVLEGKGPKMTAFIATPKGIVEI